MNLFELIIRLKNLIAKDNEVANANNDENEFTVYAGNILKQRRIELGLTRNQLAVQTRITSPIIEAIENGWVEKLPEKAYLSTMLSHLENELRLESGSLKNAIKTKSKLPAKKSFNLDLELFNGWQGVIIYSLLILISILSINHHQRKLALSNNLTVNPIKIDSIDTEISAKGLLEFRTKVPSSIIIQDGKGNETYISNIKGRLELHLEPPLVIKIEPKPKSDSILRWRGKENLILNKQGSYVINN